MIHEGLVAVAASVSQCQLTFGCTSFGWIEGGRVTGAMRGSSDFWQPQQGMGGRQQNLTPNLVRQPSSSALETPHIRAGIFRGFQTLVSFQAHFYQPHLLHTVPCANQKSLLLTYLKCVTLNTCYEIQLF